MTALSTDLITKVGNPGSATTLAAPGHTIAGTSINVDSTTNWPTDTGVIFAMDTVTLVNGVETRDTGSYTVWEGVVASATSITGMVLKYGTDQNYSAGSATRVYIIPTTTRENLLVDWGLVQHTQAGAHGAITAASVASAGAVSGTGITGTSYTQGSTRLDTGWFPGSSTWVYASSTTFTVSATEAAFMSVGTKIWLTQTTSKYFYVTGVSGTTITVTGGSDYTVANAAITAPYYSNATTPFGFPQWLNFTPTWTNWTIGTGGNAQNVGRFSMVGKEVHVDVTTFLGTSGQSVGSNPFFVLPIATTTTLYPITIGSHSLGGIRAVCVATGYDGFWYTFSNGGVVAVQPIIAAGGIGASTPGVWAAGNYLAGRFSYKVA